MFRKRVATAIAAAALASTAGLMAAPAALADGETPRSTKVEIEALKWPVLQKGDDNWQVAVAKMSLYNKVDVYSAFSEKDVGTVKAYQVEKDLVANGTIDGETWGEIRRDFGEVGPGQSGVKVSIVQTLLTNRGYQVGDDGYYGTEVEAAVRDWQEKNGIGVDGRVGPITYRALVTGGN
ncbi:peptidoglycan hydrolase-like protein with peptidoglycan-binding domain [Murinocardiopsis flavida]|uniref:Peptidoglycan hydrolase-like protein with peptidoglycan-binding domain n=1 Tax=Murinocardiopsis flavida TaxID=645275 RepID=A0A2P8DS91_9ACTN|nr:peptidoglycan-binding protein [Murinocardiopsis flavida]PSL00082.1 peptidoglycan hydrolase-like protein with peptidoglycan-binding domain [Murinocardiopsis flavida]